MSFALCESDTALNRRLEISIRALRFAPFVRSGINARRNRGSERGPVRRDSGRDEDTSRAGRGEREVNSA